MEDKIVIIDGEPYLKLVCRPGTTLYHVHIQFYVNNDGNTLGSKYIVSESRICDIDDILFIMRHDEFGKNYFFTRGEAELECARRNKEEQ